MKEIKIKVPNGETIKKIMKGMLMAFLVLFLLIGIAKPSKLMSILDKVGTKTEERLASSETKEVQEILWMESELRYTVLFSDSTFEQADDLINLADKLTERTGESYAANEGKLVKFESGKIVVVEIVRGKK